MFGIKDTDLKKVINEYQDIKSKIDLYIMLQKAIILHKEEIDNGLKT